MGRVAALNEVCIEITSACLARCAHCSSANCRGGADSLDAKGFVKVLDDIAALGASIVEFSGGEPLLRAEAVALVARAKSLGLQTRIYTSGLVARNGRVYQGIDARLARRLRRAGLDRIVFNVQAGCAVVHDRISGVRGGFDLAVTGLRAAKGEGLWAGIHFVPMKPNVRELPRLLAAAEALGVDEVAVLRFVPQGRGRENRRWLQLDHGEFGRLVREAADLTSRYPKGFLRLGSPMNFCSFLNEDVPSTQCAAGVTTMTVLPDGSVIPCPAFKGLVDYVAGSVREQGLIDIWRHAPVWERFRSFSAEALRGPCAACEYLQSCHGRCAAQRIWAWGDMHQGPDPDCILETERQAHHRVAMETDVLASAT